MNTNDKPVPRFGTACAPLAAAGFDPRWLLPAIPVGATLSINSTVNPKQIGKVQGAFDSASGTWSGRSRSYDMGKSALKHGRDAAQIEHEADWPTDGVLIIGHEIVMFDMDVTGPAGRALLERALIEVLGSQRVRNAPRRVRPDAPERCNVVFLQETAGTVKTASVSFRGRSTPEKRKELVEWRATAAYWVAGSSPHPDGEVFQWLNSSGQPYVPGAGPDCWNRSNVPTITAEEAQAVLDRVEQLIAEDAADPLASEGWELLKAPTEGATGRNGGERIDPSAREPMLDVSLFCRLLETVPCTTALWDDHNHAVGLYASFRYVLGRDAEEVTPDVLAWGTSYDGDENWVRNVWDGNARGVSVTHGRFMQFVEHCSDLELRQEVERAINGSLAGFDVVEGDMGEPPAQLAERPKRQREPSAEDGDGMHKTVPNLKRTIEFLAARPEWRGVVGYCEFRDRVMLRKPVPRLDGRMQNDFVERPWADHDDIAALAWCQGKHLPKLAKATLIDAVEALAREHRYHPVRDYLEALQWDGKPRLNTWLMDLAGAVPVEADEQVVVGGDRYLQAVGRAVLISAVARVFDPGCKVDTVLVLEAEQGAGKSRLIRTLCTDPAWHGDDLPTDLADKDAKEYLQGRWLIEIAELQQFKRTELAALKAFISTGVDQFRGLYRRRTGSVPRQSIFIATTNEDSYLQDGTGNRRFWPVRVGSVIDIDRVVRERDQLWAEAVAAYRRGEPWWIEDKAVLALAREQQADRQTTDPWDEVIRRHLDHTQPPTITIHDLFPVVDKNNFSDRTKADEMRMADVLRRLGWSKHRSRTGTAGSRLRVVWRRPA